MFGNSVSTLPSRWAPPINVSAVITIILGKISNLDSSVQFREGREVPLDLEGLDCFQLKIIFIPKWPILGQPGFGPSGASP